ncbi:MAG: magnesium transporter [Alphaproteobacteria bacterium]|nr:magnesium transporter [Alphaproteobacteria bacterium]
MQEIGSATAGGTGELFLRNDDGRLDAAWLDNLEALIEAGDAHDVRELIAPLHAADLGDVLEAIDAYDRLRLVSLLGDTFDFESLTEVDENIRLELMEFLPNATIARGVAELDSDDAVFLLEDLDEPDREEILSRMPAFERLSLKRSLDFPEESAGRRMQTEFIAIPPFWSVGQTIDYMRAEDDLPDEFFQVYVVNPGYNLLGTVPLDKLLRTKRLAKIEKIMNTNVIEVEATEDQEHAARVFDRYDLVEVAVTDESGRMVGVLTVDDIVDIIQQETDEDFRALAGVGDEEISDNVFEIMKSRLTWLFVNLVTAVLASTVIGFFDVPISKMVALAVLMPIVASMGGNAGTQTMTVTVRAIASRELDHFNMSRLIGREALVGLLNGLVFALVMGAVATLWFENLQLGLVIGVAMIVNLIAAGIAGILIPIGLERMKIDPAVASSAFVTTVTDVVGFFAFLGLAALWFQLF